MPQAPTPPIKDIVITSEDPELVEILKEIKQILDIREGRLGDTGFRFIDYYELIELLAGDETITITVLPGAHSHNHNDLTVIQGGTTNEYYHLTLAEYGALGGLPAHNDTTSKQGGTAGEYYHLTSAEHSALGTHPDHNDLSNIQGGSASERYHLTAAEHGNLHPPDIIAEGNSSVEVIDAGTGQVDTTVDTVLVLRALVDRLQFPIGLLETNTGTPIDLTVDCGTEKTIELVQGVWKDINVGGAQLNPIPAFAPDLDTFDDEGGTDTGIYTLAFDTGESASGSFEIQHDYKEGTDISFHIHWQGKAAPSGTDYVQWELTYTIARFGATLDAATTIVIETPIDTQYEMITSVFPIISGTTGGNNGGPIQMGDQFLMKIERIAAAGDAYSGDALVMTAGLHYEVDTMGSRQIGDK